MGLPLNILGHPEEVSKLFTAEGPDSPLRSGGFKDEEQQEQLVRFISTYGVMIAPKMPLNQFPPNSKIGQGIREQVNTDGSVGRVPALTPGGAEIVTHSGNLSGHYDLEYVAETILGPATEATQDASQYDDNPAKYGRRRFECEKYRASWGRSREWVLRALANGTLNAEVGDSFAPRIAHDVEDAMISGDTSLAASNKRNTLLRKNDGWLKQARTEGQYMDWGNNYVSWNLFRDTARRMALQPDMDFTGFKWWMHPMLWLDWLEWLSNRSMSVEGSAALTGQGLGPMGYSTVLVPLFPVSMGLTASGKDYARVATTIPGPKVFPPTNHQISLNIDGAGAVPIVFPNTNDSDVQNHIQTPHQIARAINQQYVDGVDDSTYNNVARVAQHGVVEILSPTQGADGSVVVAAPAESALELLGLTAGTYDGLDSGGTLYEGTPLLFGPDYNFNAHFVVAPDTSDAGIRMYTKYDQGSDKVLADMYLHMDATLYIPHLTTYVANVRRARVGDSVVA